MRILLAGPYLPDQRLGSSKLLIYLGKEFGRIGHEVHYLWLDSLPTWARHHRVSWLLFPVAVALRVAFMSVTGRPFDLIDVCSGDGWLASLLVFLLRKRPALICRSQGWEHDDLRVLLQGAASRFQRWRTGLMMRWVRLPMISIWARRSDAIIVGSSPMRELPLERGWKQNSGIHVVPYGVDEAYFSSEQQSKHRSGLLFAGSWLHRKGVTQLVEAYQSLSRSGNTMRLSIVGFGTSADSVTRDFPAQDRNRIRATDSLRTLDESEMIEEYRKHEILAFPSLYEGFGMVFLEAMASGMAVVATPTGGVVDLIKDHENGRIVPIADSNALAAAIQSLSDSPELRRRIGDTARQTARGYTWDRIAARTLDCYKAIIDRRASEQASR